MNKYLMRFTTYVVLASMLSISFWVPAAQARMISSEQVIDSQAALRDRDRLRTLLERAAVRKQLLAQGVDANAVQARVDALTDDEVANISLEIGSLPAGGDTDVVTLVGKLALIVVIALVLANPAGAVY